MDLNSYIYVCTLIFLVHSKKDLYREVAKHSGGSQSGSTIESTYRMWHY